MVRSKDVAMNIITESIRAVYWLTIHVFFITASRYIDSELKGNGSNFDYQKVNLFPFLATCTID